MSGAPAWLGRQAVAPDPWADEESPGLEKRETWGAPLFLECNINYVGVLCRADMGHPSLTSVVWLLVRRRKVKVGILTLMITCAASVCVAQVTSIRIPLAGDVDKVTFDSSNVSPDDVNRWMQLSPNVGNYNEYLIPEILDMCFSDDPRYQGCVAGRAGEEDHVNVHNAQLNIDRIRRRISELEPSRYPAGLYEIVSYVRKIQLFGLWREEAKFTFIKAEDISALETPFEELDPKSICGLVLNSIRNAKNRSEASHLARFEWSNCVTDAEMKRVGPYPQKAWEDFLATNFIREHVIREKINE
jgi:hypothetical protein